MKVIGKFNFLICSIVRNFRSFGKSSYYRNDIDCPKLSIFREINEFLGFEHLFSDNLVCKDNWNSTEKETDYQAESPFLCPPGIV